MMQARCRNLDATVHLWLGLPFEAPGRESAREIIAEVADFYGVSVSEFTSASRSVRKIAEARQHAMWEVRRRTSLSLPQIGRAFNRDHSTVLHGLRAHEARTAQ